MSHSRKSRGSVPDRLPAAAKSRVWEQRLLLGALLLTGVLLFALFSSQVEDTDFWWHLKTGQYIVEQRSLPDPDPFAFTTALNSPADGDESRMRHFNVKHEWLAQAALYIVYGAGGIAAVVLARAALLAATCALCGLLAFRRSGNAYAGIAAALATASIAMEFRADRPALVTFVMVALFIAILDARKYLWILPPLALIWANCHGGFFLGWVVLLAYCADAIPIGPRWRAASDARRLWLATAATIAVSALNPNGLGVVPTLFSYRRSEMTADLVEWHRPYLWGPPYAFDILLYATVVTLALSWRRVRRPDWLLFGVFSIAALTAFRNIMLIGIVAPILIATYFPFRFRIPGVARWGVAPALAVTIAILVSRGEAFQLHAALWKFPEGAANYVAAQHVTARMFNTYEYGGFLMWKLWPQERVFVDGRALSETLYRDYRQILYNFGSDPQHIAGPRATLLERYAIRVVVMNTFEYITGAEYPLALALAQSGPEWQLVYDDPQALVFWRNPPAGVPVFSDKLLRTVDHLENECTNYIEHSPETPLCARTLADSLLRGGNIARGRRMLVLYLSHATEHDVEAERTLRQIDAAGAR